jgi:uncharacterized membrane protein
MHKKIAIIAAVLLLVVTPVASAGFAYSDFIPDNPKKTLEDLGLWDSVELVLFALFGIAVISGIIAVLSGYISISVGGITKSASLTHSGSMTIAKAVVGALVVVTAIGVILALWKLGGQ